MKSSPPSTRRLGDILKQRFAGWTAYIFTADLRLPKLIRLAASRRIPLYNGALECRLFKYELVAGSRRREKRRRPVTSDNVCGRRDATTHLGDAI